MNDKQRIIDLEKRVKELETNVMLMIKILNVKGKK